MSGKDHARSERIRALLEEADRVTSESERVTTQLDRAMKQPFYPDRRRSVRIPSPSGKGHGSGEDAA